MARTSASAALLAAFLGLAVAGCGRPPAPASVPAALQASSGGRWGEAVDLWKRALTENPRSAALHNNLAVAFEAKGLRQEAAAEYEAARVIDSRDDYITANLVRFERAADLMPPAAEAGSPEVEEKLPARVSRVSFTSTGKPAVDLGGYKEIIATNFRPDMPAPGFGLDDWLVDSLVDGLGRLYKGTVSRQNVVWGQPARLDDPDFWKAAGAGRDAAVFLTGAVRLTGKTEKALRRESLPKDSPFKLTNRGLAERSRFKAVVECVLISSARGDVLFRESYEESRTYDVAGQSPEIAFADLFDAIRLRIFRSVLGTARVQWRYLLNR